MPRILVVDDEPDICQMIRRYAEHDGYETVGVSDGTDAVTICQKEDFDIIIMDVMMPDMDGYAACRKIRENKDIPVLMHPRDAIMTHNGTRIFPGVFFIVPLIGVVLFRQGFIVPIQKRCIIPLICNMLFR